VTFFSDLDTLKSIANFMQICKQIILEKKIINENEIEKVHILFLLFQN